MFFFIKVSMPCCTLRNILYFSARSTKAIGRQHCPCGRKAYRYASKYCWLPLALATMQPSTHPQRVINQKIAFSWNNGTSTSAIAGKN